MKSLSRILASNKMLASSLASTQLELDKSNILKPEDPTLKGNYSAKEPNK